MIAEYAACYGGFPAADTPWPLFLLAMARTGRFEARRQLSLFDAVSSAISVALGGGGGAAALDADRMRETLVRMAYPVRGDARPRFTPNLAAPENGGPSDA